MWLIANRVEQSIQPIIQFKGLPLHYCVKKHDAHISLFKRIKTTIDRASMIDEWSHGTYCGDHRTIPSPSSSP